MAAETCTVTYNLEAGAWDAFVGGCPEATQYHLQVWRRVIEKSFGHAPYYLAALDAAGSPQGLLPLFHMKSVLFGNFLVSLPFVNYGGLLCRTDTAEAALLAEAEKLRLSLGAHHVELRHCGRALAGLPASTHKVTMLLPLAGSDGEQWSRFNPKLRNQIRKAGKSGLSCTVGGSELLDGFYNVFARNMRDLGTPVYSKAFFVNAFEELSDRARVISVDCGGTTVAAGIATWNGKTIEVPWASSIAEFRPLCPNDMLYWEAIRFGIAKGLTTFDFGRSTVGEGTFHFKKQWGAQPVQLYWQYLLDREGVLPLISPKNPHFRVAIKMWKRLPVAVTRLVGPAIVRNIP